MAKTVDKYTIQVKTKGARGSAQSLDKVGKGAKSMAKAMGVAKIAVAALGAALISGITYAGRTAAEFEALKTRLNTLYGSVTKGTKAFNEFNKIASTTPFALKSVVEAGATLKAFGVDAEKNMKGVADLAAFMGVDVVEAAQAMGRGFAGGAGAADVLRERGVLELIKSFKGIEDLTDLTLPEFRKALEEAMIDPTLGIAGATDALSETFTGAYSNMWDSVDKLANAVGENLLPLMKDLTKGIGKFADDISGAKSPQQENIDMIRNQGIALRLLQSDLNNSSEGTHTYKLAMDRLTKEYPDLIKHLGDEKDNLEKRNTAIQEWVDGADDRITILKKEMAIEAMKTRYTEMIKEKTDASIEFGQSVVEVGDSVRDVYLDIVDGLPRDDIEEFYSAMGKIDEAQRAFWEGDINQTELVEQTKLGIQEFQNALMEAEVDPSTLETIGNSFFDALKMTMPSIKGLIPEDIEDLGVEQLLPLSSINAILTELEENFANVGETGSYFEQAMQLITAEIEKAENGLDSFIEKTEQLPAETEKPLGKVAAGFKKFGTGVAKITGKMQKEEFELAKAGIEMAGAIAMATAGGKESQLKIQKAMIVGNVAKGMIDIWTDPTPTGPLAVAKAVALSATLVARGVSSSKQIDEQIAQINKEKTKSQGGAGAVFAQYGMNQIVDGPTPIIAGEAGAELVQITPLEGANLEGPQGGGSIIITGNVLSRDFVQGELADEIREAIRQGYDFR